MSKNAIFKGTSADVGMPRVQPVVVSVVNKDLSFKAKAKDLTQNTFKDRFRLQDVRENIKLRKSSLTQLLMCLGELIVRPRT